MRACLAACLSTLRPTVRMMMYVRYPSSLVARVVVSTPNESTVFVIVRLPRLNSTKIIDVQPIQQAYSGCDLLWSFSGQIFTHLLPGSFPKPLAKFAQGSRRCGAE